MAKVLAKEVSPFNIRILTVSLGAFNTNMPAAAAVGQNPIPDDYRGGLVDKITQAITTGTHSPDGDVDKAVRVIYDVVMSGSEETFLPLGRDVAVRVQEVCQKYTHALDVFGDVCADVRRDDSPSYTGNSKTIMSRARHRSPDERWVAKISLGGITRCGRSQAGGG